MVQSHMVHSTFKPFAIMTSLSFLPYTGRVRNHVVGHESDSPQVVFNVQLPLIWRDTTSCSIFHKLTIKSQIKIYIVQQLSTAMVPQHMCQK